MRAKDFYNYANPEFSAVRDPMRRVMKAYGNAERWFAHIKEVTWADYGSEFLTNGLHAMEHIQPIRVDTFKGVLAQWGLEVEYPPIAEFLEPLPDYGRIFEVSVSIVDEIHEALLDFIRVTDGGRMDAAARQVEQLEIDNSKDRAWLIQAWKMWDTGVSFGTMDSWVKKLLHEIADYGND